ncbi:NADH ubiquinone oxidoreductase subunit NDUFA12-domain-containing protein [Lipomyces chichibuensis]|uniref:NADH ubiquinone oxidoreductase subunit NDUFA12-domain-containing protein n=1 Tax=Lipomyces chichibuensis TaxID=1546026 RepID=UPI003343FA95
MSSSLIRVIRNLRRVGIKDYFRQMNSIGDTKYGRLVGVDRYGNKFFENTEEDEIHLRTRWVQYKDWFYDVSQIEPAWHGWLGYLVDTPPNELKPEQKTVRKYPTPEVIPTGTGTRNAYVPYSTVKPKVSMWSPTVSERTA